MTPFNEKKSAPSHLRGLWLSLEIHRNVLFTMTNLSLRRKCHFQCSLWKEAKTHSVFIEVTLNQGQPLEDAGVV